ncbi:MAG: hypothetical protein ACF8CQ_14075 [Rhodopirellula sp. JB044]|uniref:hypothetical protein n=1 Tax=Rhodopirellula sp. JB044 TaxID=3342844 RepID=UPI00370B08E5
MQANGESIYGTTCSPVDFDFWWGAMTQKDKMLYLHILEWPHEGVEFNGVIGKPSKAYFLADPQQKSLPLSYEADGHVTKMEVPTKSLDPRNTVIAVVYENDIEADPDAQGKYHWYINRRTRHTDIRQNRSAGQQMLPKAVTDE